MQDGSRHFVSLPEARAWNMLRDHIARLPGVTIEECLSDGMTEVWIDFSYRGYKFTVNNQLGEYWFFVSDPRCPEQILEEVALHCSRLPGKQ